jgi:hypothetical protein
MKIVNTILRVLLGLFLLMPVTGGLGMMPEPTEEMYSPEGWMFMSALMNSGYMMPLIALTCLACAILLFANRTALAAILLAPFTINVIAFHVFLDAAPISAAAIPAYILLMLNAYFLWVNTEKYRQLWK